MGYHLNGLGTKARVSQTVTRYLLAALMSYAGITHLTSMREEFQAQVPTWLPVDKDTVVVASGVAEIGLGVALAAFPAHRRLTGVALAAFYAAIFPGNIAQYAERNGAFGLDTDGKRLARLFGQPGLIAAALWAGGIPIKRPRD
ncbi:hypothetical protein [Stomatohabitans albus]|uniref:DoxX family protein n=1 Tax=Stomatohabitans albus TaxID=3110766 RepID=UPI003AB9A801